MGKKTVGLVITDRRFIAATTLRLAHTGGGHTGWPPLSPLTEALASFECWAARGPNADQNDPTHVPFLPLRHSTAARPPRL